MAIKETLALKQDYIQFQGDLSAYLVALEKRVAILEKTNETFAQLYTNIENKHVDLEQSYISTIKHIENNHKLALETIEAKYKQIVEKQVLEKTTITKKPIEENLNILGSNRYDALGWRKVKHKSKK
jgi:chloramphenicol O-acetyltransferase